MVSRRNFILWMLLNLALIGGLAALMKQRYSRSQGSVSGNSIAAAAGTRLIAVRTNVLDWRAVESTDYREYIANLRSIGCPEETIRDIIVADVNKLFEDRKKSLKKPEDNFKFWETGSRGIRKAMGNVLNEETIKQKQTLAAERRELIKALLGVEVEDKPDVAGMLSPLLRQLAFLPDSKQVRVLEILELHQAQLSKFSGKEYDSARGQLWDQARKDRDTKLAAILTPEELENYQLRLSETATKMRFSLERFDPTEQEFRAVFKLQKEFDDEFAIMFSSSELGDGSSIILPGSPKSKELQAKRQEALNDLKERIKNTLGEQRYADYLRAQDPEFRAINDLADAQGLPKESAGKVYEIKMNAQQQVKALRADLSLGPDQRSAALKTLRADTEQRISEAFGPAGLNAYKNGMNAYWLNYMDR